MPLVRIDLAKGRSAKFRKTIGEIIYKAMRDTINVPEDDKFQIITEHPPEQLNYASSYLGVPHKPGIVFIQVTMNAGRTVAMKQAFFKEIAEQLHAQLKLRKEDVIINLVEIAKENWSFGNGVAQYVEA
jgi:phenylpyruvate tautomerase PptA (4-oxalocrotonate tautomerase family)